MALRNAFENLSLESTQANILAAVAAVQAAVEGTLNLPAGAASESTLADLLTANHADLVAIRDKLSSDPATQATLAAILAQLNTILLTEDRSVVRTGFTYNGDGDMTGYIEDGVVWTIARNGDGSIASVTHA